MKTWDNIFENVQNIQTSNWNIRQGKAVPDVENVQLGNFAVEIECAILYADMRGSTHLVKTYKDSFAAKMYKTFLCTSCDIIRNNHGEIVSFDGDRVMAAFCGASKCSDAARSGLQLYAMIESINKNIARIYPTDQYRIDYAVGIDVSRLFVIKTGIRGANDLAWIGTAANNAAKLSELRSYNEKTFITKRVFDCLHETVKYNSKKTQCMWKSLDVNVMGEPVLGSSWYWNFK